jgi:hypothetical protein
LRSLIPVSPSKSIFPQLFTLLISSFVARRLEGTLTPMLSNLLAYGLEFETVIERPFRPALFFSPKWEASPPKAQSKLKVKHGLIKVSALTLDRVTKASTSLALRCSTIESVVPRDSKPTWTLPSSSTQRRGRGTHPEESNLTNSLFNILHTILNIRAA